MISAAIVLPVPDGPVNSAFTPLPSDSFRSNPHSSQDAAVVDDPLADLTQLRQRVRREARCPPRRSATRSCGSSEPRSCPVCRRAAAKRSGAAT